MKTFLIIFGLFFSLNNINAQYKTPHKYTMKELNEGEIRIIDEFRTQQEAVKYSKDLMTVAKNEASRLAQQSRLTPPSVNLLGNKNYFGYSWIFTDIKPGKQFI
jgi:hypothetical protein